MLPLTVASNDTVRNPVLMLLKTVDSGPWDIRPPVTNRE
jgi:hypothetical protein